MTAGTIVTIAIGCAIYIAGSDKSYTVLELGGALGQGFKLLAEALSSPAAAVLFFLLVNAVGGLIEVLAELFVARFTSNIAWAVTEPIWSVRYRNVILTTIEKMVKKLFFRSLAPVRIYYGLVMAVKGQSIYRWEELKKELKDETQLEFDRYPGVVIDGLMEPFGKYSSVPWTYFADHGRTSGVRALARTLESRNRDMLTIVTSLLIATTLFATCFLTIFADDIMNWLRYIPIFNGEAAIVAIILILWLVMVIPLVMFVLLYGYFILVRQSIVTILECNRFDAKLNTNNQASEVEVTEVNA